MPHLSILQQLKRCKMTYESWKKDTKRREAKRIARLIKQNKKGALPVQVDTVADILIAHNDYLKAENWQYTDKDFDEIRVRQFRKVYTYSSISEYQKALYSGEIPNDNKDRPWCSIIYRPRIERGNKRVLILSFLRTKEQDKIVQNEMAEQDKKRKLREKNNIFHSMDELKKHIKTTMQQKYGDK